MDEPRVTEWARDKARVLYHEFTSRSLDTGTRIRARMAQELDAARDDGTAAAKAEIVALREVLHGVLDGRDCPFCDRGRLRKRVDGRPPFHDDDCAFEAAGRLLAATPSPDAGATVTVPVLDCLDVVDEDGRTWCRACRQRLDKGRPDASRTHGYDCWLPYEVQDLVTAAAQRAKEGE